MEAYSPVVFSWDEPCSKAFVTGDFNQFALKELIGVTSKAAVVWVAPGTYYYRYMIDGCYTTAASTPTESKYGRLYHKLSVGALPFAIRDFMQMTPEEMEKIDHELFRRNSECDSSYISEDEAESSPFQISPIREVSCKYSVHQVKEFFPLKAAVTKIQATIRMFICRTRYLNHKAAQSLSRRSTAAPAGNLAVPNTSKTKLDEDSVLAHIITANFSLNRSLRSFNRSSLSLDFSFETVSRSFDGSLQL